MKVAILTFRIILNSTRFHKKEKQNLLKLDQNRKLQKTVQVFLVT